MEARRLRVPELRDELGRRGLDTRGLKSELTERLQAALDGEGARRDGAEGRYGLDNHSHDPQGGYNNPQGGYNNPQDGYQDPQGGYQDHQGGYQDPQDPQGGYQDPQGHQGHEPQGYQTYKGQEAEAEPGYERRALEQEPPRLPPDLKPPDSRPDELAPPPAPPPNYPVPPPPTFPTPPYGLPPPGYAPHPNYSAPPPNYSAPHPNYNAPPPNYNAPPPNFNAPPPNYNAPPPNYSAPPPNYSAPPPNYAAPPPNYHTPPPNYTSPPPNYGAPPPNYPAPPPHYPAPPFPAPPPVFGGGPEPAPPPPGRKRPLEEQRGRGGHEQRPEKRPRSPEPPAEDEEEEFDDSLVTVDTYNCDLHFKVARDRYSGHPLTIEGFAYLWSGARATHGATRGRVCFEIKVTEALPVQHLPPSEPDPHVVRVGWSLDCCSTQLGEEPFSYGYGGTGRKSTEGKFQSYGETFGESDVIACLADFEAGDSVELSFLKNGRWQGPAFRVPHSALRGRALFPHVLLKNCAVEFNFGQRAPLGTPGTLPPGYCFIQQLPPAHRERGTRGPRSKAECEILMMVGLPAAGKTTWAVKHAAANPDKKYNILGTNAIMDKMRVMGLKRQRNYAGRWDVLIQQATQCLNRLIQIAARKRRNYILDQTNVYGSAQRRKLRPFAGFRRRAVVICPTDAELRARTRKRTDEEGKDVPEHAVLEMKANFTLPEPGEFLDSVQFVELQRDEAAALVRRYNQEGRSAAGAGHGHRDGHGDGHGDGHRDGHRDRQDRQDGHTEPFRGRPSGTFRGRGGRGFRGAGSGNGLPRGCFPPPRWGSAPPPPPPLPLPPPPPQPPGGFQSPQSGAPAGTHGQGQQFPPSWQQLPQGPPWPFLGSSQ